LFPDVIFISASFKNENSVLEAGTAVIDFQQHNAPFYIHKKKLIKGKK